METKFTPGPWTFENWVSVSDGGDCPLYIKSKNGTIADMNFNVPSGIGSSNCTANARLISAAPDMFEVVKELYDWSINANVRGSIFPKLEAAYLKATGQPETTKADISL